MLFLSPLRHGFADQVDLNKSAMAQCSAGDLRPIDAGFCPDNRPSVLGQLGLWTIPGLFGGFLLLFVCGRRHPSLQFWVMLVTYWAADLGAGLATGMYAQMFYPNGPTKDRIFLRESLASSPFVAQLGVAFIFQLTAWDWPMQLLKLLLSLSCWPCKCRRTLQGGLFLLASCLIGSSCMYMAVDAAYRCPESTCLQTGIKY